MRQGQAQRLGHHLRGGRRSQELTTAAGRTAGPASQVGCLVQRNESMRESGSEGLDGARIFAALGRQRDAAGNQHGRQVQLGGQGHHHGGQSLVAGGHAEHPDPLRQGSDQPAEDNGRVIAIRQAIEHAHRALGATITGIGYTGSERQRLAVSKRLSRRPREETNLPMARVVAQRDGATIFGPDSALGAEDEELLAAQFGRVPSHARILSHAEEVPAGSLAQHRLGQREFPGRTRPAGPQAGQIWRKMSKEFSNGHDPRNPLRSRCSKTRSRLAVRGHVGVPGPSRFRRNLGESQTRRGIGNADQVLAARALNLAPGEPRLALERLVAVGTKELEFRGLHDRSEATGPAVRQLEIGDRRPRSGARNRVTHICRQRVQPPDRGSTPDRGFGPAVANESTRVRGSRTRMRRSHSARPVSPSARDIISPSVSPPS